MPAIEVRISNLRRTIALLEQAPRSPQASTISSSRPDLHVRVGTISILSIGRLVGRRRRASSRSAACGARRRPLRGRLPGARPCSSGRSHPAARGRRTSIFVDAGPRPLARAHSPRVCRGRSGSAPLWPGTRQLLVPRCSAGLEQLSHSRRRRSQSRVVGEDAADRVG